MPASTARQRHSAICSHVPSTSPLIPPILRIDNPTDRHDSDDHHGNQGQCPPSNHDCRDGQSEQHADDRLASGSRLAVVGAETGMSCHRSDPHQPDGGAAPYGVCSHRREKHCTGAGERSEADNAQNDGAAQGGYAVAAVTWILQDFQSTVDRRASGEGVGHVGETVLVERSGDQQPDRNRDGGRHDRRHQVPKSGGGSSDSRADQCADNWEPDDAGGHIRLAPQSDRDSCQELNGGEQAQPNHSPKVGTSVMPAHAMATSGTAAIAPEPSPSRISKSRSGRLPRS